MWMRRDAIERPLDTSLAGNCFVPSRKGGRFSSAPQSRNMSLVVKPWSAIIDTPGLIFLENLTHVLFRDQILSQDKGGK